MAQQSTAFAPHPHHPSSQHPHVLMSTVARKPYRMAMMRLLMAVTWNGSMSSMHLREAQRPGCCFHWRRMHGGGMGERAANQPCAAAHASAQHAHSRIPPSHPATPTTCCASWPPSCPAPRPASRCGPARWQPRAGEAGHAATRHGGTVAKGRAGQGLSVLANTATSGAVLGCRKSLPDFTSLPSTYR